VDLGSALEKYETALSESIIIPSTENILITRSSFDESVIAYIKASKDNFLLPIVKSIMWPCCTNKKLITIFITVKGIKIKNPFLSSFKLLLLLKIIKQNMNIPSSNKRFSVENVIISITKNTIEAVNTCISL
jgi:hypothetical protein